MSLPTVNHGQAREDRFAEPQVFVGYEVRDPLGRKIGTAEGVFANRDNEPEYVQVKLGFFGLRSVLIPVQLVAADAQQRVLKLQ